MTDLEHIDVGYATEGQGAGPVFVTLRAGLFEREGLDARVRQLGSASGVVKGLLEGAVQFGNLAAPALMHAVLDGAPLRYITGGINQQFLVARPGIDRLEQLQNGRLGASGPHDLGFLLNQYLITRLAGHGITGLSIKQVGSSRERLRALLDGALDAAPMSPPIAIEARQAGCRFLVDFADYGLNFTLGGVATTQALLDQRPELVQRFVRAYVAGMHRYKTDRPLTLQVQAEYSGLSDPAIAEQTYTITEPGFPRAPYPVTTGLQILLSTLANTDPRAGATDPSVMVDDRFVRHLDESGWIGELYAGRSQAPA